MKIDYYETLKMVVAVVEIRSDAAGLLPVDFPIFLKTSLAR